MKYLQYGCGLRAPENWINFDSSPSLIFSKIPIVKDLFKRFVPPFPSNVRYGNIVKGLPVSPESIQLIYASHVLEHLSLNDCRIAIRNTYIMLVKGGLFRLVVPDLEWCIKEYQTNPVQKRAYKFMKNTKLGIEWREYGLIGFLRNTFGNTTHLWMWDYDSLKIELANIGFTNIRRANFNDSSAVEFRDVEEIGRFENALAIECIK